MSEQPRIGIDLGTTNSVVAVFQNGEPRVLASETGHSLIPSVIALADDGTLLVGPAARERSAYAPSVSRFKPWMGEDRLAQIGTSELSPVQLSTLILEEMKGIAEAALGCDVASAVITVPAWFREPQRKATIQAAELAGLKVDRIINEPTAAAIAWGLHQGEREANVLVLDLGGGTFDVTVVELFDGVVEVLSSVGDTHLGGEDFTDALVRLVEDQRGAPVVEATQRARLRTACEKAKRALSVSDTVPLRWGPSEGMLVTKQAFETRAAGLLGRMRQCVREAMLQARLAPANIQEVLLVGGATRMPLVRDFAEEMFPSRVRAELDPDHVVALGAAVQAALVAQDEAVRDFVVTDVTPFSLGVGIVRAFKGTEINDSFDPILHRGTTIPTSRTARYKTTHHQQTAIRLEVFQGERRVASENQRLGELVVSELPVDDSPNHRVGVLVRFTHDLNGLLEVEATVPATGQVVKTVIEQQPGAMTDAERQSALKALSMLKRAPRELLPNRYVLERGRRLFELLPFDQRAELDEMLLRFEAALLNEDEAEVNEARRALGELVDEVALQQGLELDPADP